MDSSYCFFMATFETRFPKISVFMTNCCIYYKKVEALSFAKGNNYDFNGRNLLKKSTTILSVQLKGH